MCQWPPAERTIESPMASPRPAPEPCSVARRNLSNSRGRSASAMPGPLSSTVRPMLRMTRPATGYEPFRFLFRGTDPLLGRAEVG
jgi:hypothetical protein